MSGIARATWDRVMESHSGVSLTWGPTDVDRFLGDPKRVAFFLSRYKFAAKMLSQCESIIDVGCGSGMGTLTFLSDTIATKVLGLDFEPRVIDHAVDHLLMAAAKVRDVDALEFVCCDFMNSPYVNFSGLCCLDVIEHIEPYHSDMFVERLALSLNGNGVAVVGTPNEIAAQYGSVHSKIGHINLFDAYRLREALEKQFRHVFMFSMNDEIVHTGFDRLAHYLIAVAVK